MPHTMKNSKASYRIEANGTFLLINSDLFLITLDFVYFRFSFTESLPMNVFNFMW